MNIHKNAGLTPHGRERIVRLILNGQAPQGAEGLQDRSSRPRRLHRPTPQAIVERIEVLRRQRMPGKQIAAEVGVSPATVSRILKRLGLNRLAALEATEPAPLRSRRTLHHR